MTNVLSLFPLTYKLHLKKNTITGICGIRKRRITELARASNNSIERWQAPIINRDKNPWSLFMAIFEAINKFSGNMQQRFHRSIEVSHLR
jgi:hypothetical protein